jgi:NhaA family Na+:H+ antiporter
MLKRFTTLMASDLGAVLPMLAAAVLALILANTALHPSVDAFLHAELSLGISPLVLSKSLLHWINDGLMVSFFMMVGLEIKREVVEGELSRPSQVALPVAGALGGIVVPAAVYVAFTWRDPQALHGWAIASATDIAFAVAVLAALGKRVPGGLKLFLLTLAIVDDLAAIVVIALFYTNELSTLSLGLAGLCIAGLVAMNLGGVRRAAPYLLLGIVLWVCVLKSGVHATLAGVVLAFCIPIGPAYHRLEHALKPLVSYVVLPAFAFANSGLALSGIGAAAVFDPITLGIVAGLFLGKQFGIFAAAGALVRMGYAHLPAGASWGQLYGVGVCGGIGFTMSLFIGSLAFHSESQVALVRLGVVVASLLSAVLGYLLLRFLNAGAAPDKQ